ncbi:hypothetical protein JKF63_06524 [Porcisia hertigi]|uniref:Uncharacterized protein n=1 Tax=Porcisia hertigi TaxID=2761500 RepID=A0A836LG84_9TRYP|nr:hypothetical protein JKF63_06524 [Porcisia hertigi]
MKKATMAPISFMAMMSLFVLVMQNSLLVVMTRFSLMNVTPVDNYHTSTLVLNQEILKMISCLIIYALDDLYKQPQHDFTSHHDADEVTQVVTEFEGDVSVTTNKQASHVDRTALQLESTRKYSLLDEEVPGKCTISPVPLPLPHAVAVASVACEGNCHVVDDCATGQRASKLPKTPIKSRSGAAAHAGGSPVKEPRPSCCTVSSNRMSILLAGSNSTAGGDSLNGGVRVPAKTRRRGALILRRIQSHVRLYCTMLSNSLWRRDTLRLFIPALLFNMQNFLIFVGLSNLDAVSFQVWSQTKLLFAALFSVWLLDRKLSAMQWLSLVALTAGVLGAQFGAPRPTRSLNSIPVHSASPTQPCISGCSDSEELHVGAGGEHRANQLIGIAACVLSGVSSSYASVYFEKVVKTTSATLSVRNIQLSLFGIPFAFISMLILDVFPSWYASVQCGQSVHWNIFSAEAAEVAEAMTNSTINAGCRVRPFYFWQRYDRLLTWGLVAIHALGGLLVAMVVKYADNILKGFATGIAVVISGLMSSVVSGYEPSLAFVLGAALVTGSGITFHKFEPKH